jgi:hypothetical protein
MDRLSWIMYAAIRLWERGQLETTDEVDNASLEHFVEWRLGKETDRRDPAYLERIDTISSST